MVVLEGEYHRKRDCYHRCEEQVRGCEKSGRSPESCGREFNRCIAGCEFTSQLSLDPDAMP